MSQPAIRFERVSKKYRLNRGVAGSILDDMGDAARRLFGRPVTPRETFWALKDVSFEVEQGETLGLIGANGAGKSTALKILSRITVPTTGQFTVNGTVGALIEVGAGFHHDLTGRENVYLSGAIRGMRRSEIDAKFDAIVAFSEVEKFLDTPVKYYSSGMMVRLGFAVAAHIDPDVLLIDEVLAVGDAAFQAKCLNKLAELKEQDKTIVLVTHNMVNILRHCGRVLWIDRGVVRGCGEAQQMVDEYLASAHQGLSDGAEAVALDTDRPIRIRSVRVCDDHGRPAEAFRHGDTAVIEIAYEVVDPVHDPVVSVVFRDVRGIGLGGLTTRLDGVKVETGRPAGLVRLSLSPILFTHGSYVVSVAIMDARIQRHLDLRSPAAQFTVDGPRISSREVQGHVVYPHRWTVEATDA